MIGDAVVLRKWTGRIRTADQDQYGEYVSRTGAKDYGSTPGNLGWQILMRPLGDGTSEVTTLSWWVSMDAIRKFAGAEPELARYYPEDDRFLIDRPLYVEHHRVVGSQVQLTMGLGSTGNRSAKRKIS